MPDWDADSEHDVGVVSETQKQVKKPPLYKVLLHNDDYTSMEFVVHVLPLALSSIWGRICAWGER